MSLEKLKSKFSENESYILETIPSFNYFKRKNWIQEKVSSLGNQKVLVFTKKKSIMFAFLESDQDYWLPFEKGRFFLKASKSKSSSVLIAENVGDYFNYYGFVEDFLVVYTRDFNEAIDSIKTQNNNKDVDIFGFGYIDDWLSDMCKQRFSFDQVENIVLNLPKDHSENAIEDDLVYLNEGHDQGEFVSKSKSNFDSLFFQWFENSLTGKTKSNKIYLKYILAAFALFLSADLYFIQQKFKINKEIEETCKKLEALSAENKRQNIS